MKLNGNGTLIDTNSQDTNHHVVTKNPLRNDALKIELISEKFRDIIDILGFDLNDDSIKDTPNRVAKMYINEVFKGLNPK